MEDRKWGRRRCWGWRGEKQQMEEEEEGRVSIRGSTPALGSERRIMKLETSFFFPQWCRGMQRVHRWWESRHPKRDLFPCAVPLQCLFPSPVSPTSLCPKKTPPRASNAATYKQTETRTVGAHAKYKAHANGDSYSCRQTQTDAKDGLISQAMLWSTDGDEETPTICAMRSVTSKNEKCSGERVHCPFWNRA